MIHPLDLTLPDLPSDLEGLRIGQLSDLHVKADRARYRMVARCVATLAMDLTVLTGDYMCEPGDEHLAFDVLARICQNIRPRFGIVGVFGNHDSRELRKMCQRLPVTWLNNSAHFPDDLPLQVAGFETLRNVPPDSLATLDAMSHGEGLVPQLSTGQHGEVGALRILLSHQPSYLLIAADMGFQLMFSGHTHGGQIRLPWARALVNSSDFPAALTSGVLRHRRTLCAISRGLGETGLAMRLFCPPQIPLYTLRRGPMPGTETDQIQNVHPW